MLGRCQRCMRLLAYRTRWRTLAVLVVCMGFVVAIVGWRVAHRPRDCGAPFRCDRVMVGFKPGTSPARIAEIHADLGSTVISAWTPTGLYEVQPPPSMTAFDASDYYMEQPEVDFALPDLVLAER